MDKKHWLVPLNKQYNCPVQCRTEKLVNESFWSMDPFDKNVSWEVVVKCIDWIRQSCCMLIVTLD